MAQAVGAGGKVVAFEPTIFAYEKLQADLALNPALAARVETRQAMLLERGDPVPDQLYASWPLVAEKRPG